MKDRRGRVTPLIDSPKKPVPCKWCKKDVEKNKAAVFLSMHPGPGGQGFFHGECALGLTEELQKLGVKAMREI
jgi:hypothetical protein